ncbi:MAG TPA: NAD(+) synthase [Candidatus Alectryocaccobium stercorigallinarum]|nr:NAD(+) synthase [Candidatus Alectryocaccobium stercorigallinarum]
MKHGFIKVAAGTPKIQIANCPVNTGLIIDEIKKMEKAGAKIMVLPELCISGFECRDLFWQERLLKECLDSLKAVADSTADVDALIFVGLPVEAGGKLFNCAAALNHGKVLGLIPKTHIPNYNEFYEGRYFSKGNDEAETIELFGEEVPFGTDIIFSCAQMPHLKVAAEICEDLWVPDPPSVSHALAGATIIVNPSASDEMTGKAEYRSALVNNQSARLICGYIYASAGDGESTTDLVFSGHNLICENGITLKESKRFENEMIYTEIDVDRLVSERRRMSTFPVQSPDWYTVVSFDLNVEDTELTRNFDPQPFVPSDKYAYEKRCDEILNMQAFGLKKRLEHTHCTNAVVGISGGLDSTLALLVTARAFDLAGIERNKITAITMPCFGTTDKTYNNACTLSKCLGAQLREVDIKKSVSLHFSDIGHDPENHNVTYENAQARERTQVLMDIANESGGLVIGTGDLSELALGWATYNGDHMSMYAVNCSVPKTLVRHLVRYYADTCGDKTLSNILIDVLNTPVSPELLPPKDGVISQKTEELVGPYELHDFFLYYMLRMCYEPDKIYRIAKKAFKGTYDDEFILGWLKSFYRRFFSQQFKRSCLPDGPKVGSVAVSPRGDLRMPSDACADIWLKQLESL